MSFGAEPVRTRVKPRRAAAITVRWPLCVRLDTGKCHGLNLIADRCLRARPSRAPLLRRPLLQSCALLCYAARNWNVSSVPQVVSHLSRDSGLDGAL
jgi:hypothetical protein